MRISWIEEGKLACGGIPFSLENLQSLYEQGIRAILTLTEHPLTVQKALRAELFESMGIDLLHVPVVDQHAPTGEQVRDAHQFVLQMHSVGKAVYLHCHAGVGRTGTMLHALYMTRGMTLSEVKELVRQKRAMSQFIMLSDAQRAFLEQLDQQDQRKSD